MSRRIVVYTEAVGRGGAEVSLRNLLAALDTSYDVTVMGVDGEICAWVASARTGTEIVVVRPVRHKLAIGALIALRREIARLRPDVFHVNLREIADAQYAVAAALTVHGVDVVAVEQLPYAPATRLARRLKRWTSSRLAAHVAVGERAARLVEETVALRRGSVLTIYNGVPDLGAARERFVRPETVIGTLARFDRIKGLDLLLEAAAELPATKLVLVGEGPERDELVAQSERLGLAGRVQFVPWSDSARELLREMDVFVLPSRNEGFPLSIVEAMLAGLPVVASDVGSVPEAVVDGVTGCIVPPGDVASLRQALARLVDDRELRLRMGRAARGRALERFTSDAMARAFEQLYEQLGRVGGSS
jgi:glycosyltransferase involved in cell wall biosynthesis